jgi:hypothetical protein
MSVSHIDFSDDFVEEALARADDLADRVASGLDHIHAGKRDLRRVIDVVANARVDTGALTGRALDHVLELLVEIEGDLSRAEGELADADPNPRF